MRKLTLRAKFPEKPKTLTEDEQAWEDGWRRKHLEVEQDIGRAVWNIYIVESRDVIPGLIETRHRLARTVTWQDLMKDPGLEASLKRHVSGRSPL